MFDVDQLAHLLVCLVCLETMAVKNFVFRANWVGSMVADIKNFFVIFDRTWTHILPLKGPNKNLLKQYFNFNQLERQKLYYYQFCNF